MKLVRFILFLLCLALEPAFAGIGEGVSASLQTETASPLDHTGSFTATITLDLQPGWHTYWANPGDSGLPPKVVWHLPPGWIASPLEFSIPSLFKEPGDMTIYGYEHSSSLRATITPPKGTSEEEILRTELKASLTWLACKELCVPGSTDLSVLIGNHGKRAFHNDPWPEQGEPPFPVHQSFKKDSYYLSFEGSSGAVYQLYPSPLPAPSDGPVHQSAEEFSLPPSIVMAAGTAISILQPWNGTTAFRGLLVETIGPLKKAWWIRGHPTQPTHQKENSPSLLILVSALVSGFLGGMILNLMPCVLPVISLKIFGFIAQAGESPGRILRHGLTFAAGIFVWFLGLGFLVIMIKAGGAQVTWGAFQFQNSYFVTGLSFLVFLFALNLLGVFEITLPGAASNKLDQIASSPASGSSYAGSFFQGLFATLLATPCTAPFLGSALGFAFGQSPIIILAMFTAVALGMSAPYLILSARPGWRQWIPKPGAWMERLKQFMAFPLLATNLWLLWVLQNQRGGDAALILSALFLIIGFCAWALGALSASSWNSAWLIRILILLVAACSMFLGSVRIAAMSLTPKMTTTGDGIGWIPYSPQSLERLRDDGKPVFLDFTASWCLTCQFNERTAIDVPAVRKLMKERGITAMKGDWTNSDPEITDALRSFGRVGVPLALFYPSGKGSSPVILPELLTEKIVLEALGK